MDIIINDLMGQYMQASDNLAADGLLLVQVHQALHGQSLLTTQAL
jgi:hypothetical protein